MFVRVAGGSFLCFFWGGLFFVVGVVGDGVDVVEGDVG